MAGKTARKVATFRIITTIQTKYLPEPLNELRKRLFSRKVKDTPPKPYFPPASVDEAIERDRLK